MKFIPKDTIFLSVINYWRLWKNLKTMVKQRTEDLKTLEYFKFLDYLSQLTPNEKTKEKIKGLKPAIDRYSVENRITRTQEFLNILNHAGYFPLSEFPEVDTALELLSIEESILSPQEILDIGSILKISRDIKNFLSPYIKETQQLQIIYKDLYSSREIERIITDSIDPSGMIKDSASRDLYNIRKNIKEVEKQITTILEKLLNNSKFADILQDRIITIRRDRYVIPVKHNFAGKIQGIIQDRSSSGQTVYLEPVGVVELNNRLSDLKLQEHIEIRKILKFITDILRDKYQHISRTYQAIIEFDFLYTIGKYSREFGCVFPKLSDRMDLKQVRHPIFLFMEKEFKPIDLRLGEKKKGLIITGPNTGGKTIALKTAGLSALLVQSGIPVPAEEGSEIPVSEGIFADIGDMQSIEQNLSTFSAHIKNIKEILQQAGEKSLLLLDELIPGTDPDEGAAIGIGILHKIKELNAYVMATTHFKQIKIFALSDDYFEVASVGFDKETLSPTYTLHYNSVGESMAFYIAEKLGIDEEVLDIARKYIDETFLQLEKAIQELEVYKAKYEEELKELEQLKSSLSEQKEKYDRLLKELQKEKEKRWETVKKEAEDYLKQLREEGYQILQELKTTKSGKNLEQFLKERKNLHLKEQEEEISQDIDIGDFVRLKGKGTVGEVISVRENKVHVNFNGIKIWTKKSDLEKVKQKKKTEVKFNFSRKRDSSFKPEIKLIGKTKEEAIKELEQFIDRAITEGFSTVRIIHGYGSGILRKAVREYLDTLPYKISYEDAPYNEGGMGVTIAHIQ